MGVMLLSLPPLKGRVIDSKEFRRLEGDDTTDLGAVEKLFLDEDGGEPVELGCRRPSMLLMLSESKLERLLLLFGGLLAFFGKNDNSDAGIRMMDRTWPS